MKNGGSFHSKMWKFTRGSISSGDQTWQIWTYLKIPHLVWWCLMLFISKLPSWFRDFPAMWLTLAEGNTVFIEHLWLIVNSLAPVLYFSDLALVIQQTGILGKDSRISRLVRSNTWYILYFKLLQFEWWQTHVAMEPLEVLKVICIGDDWMSYYMHS